VKPGVADSCAREDDVGEHLSKIGEPVQGEINLPERIRTGNVTSVTPRSAARHRDLAES
jgi:hypothetical protein